MYVSFFMHQFVVNLWIAKLADGGLHCFERWFRIGEKLCARSDGSADEDCLA